MVMTPSCGGGSGPVLGASDSGSAPLPPGELPDPLSGTSVNQVLVIAFHAGSAEHRDNEPPFLLGAEPVSKSKTQASAR